MFSLSDFPVCWLMEFTCSSIFLNGVIYLSQKRKKKTYLIWNSRLRRRVRELCDQGSPAHPQETCSQCQQPHSYCLVPVCSELLTTVRSIYYLPSQGITMEWYGLIAQQHAKTYPLHPAQPAQPESSRSLSAWGRQESGRRTAGLKQTLTSQCWWKGENPGRMKQYTSSPSSAGLCPGWSKYDTVICLTRSIFGTECLSRSNHCTPDSPAGITIQCLCLQYFQVRLL